MREAWDMEDDAMLWAGTNFFGGIKGHQEGPCGAISGLAIALGFRYRDTSGDPEQAQKKKELANEKTDELVREFKEKFGSIVCLDLVGGADFSDPEQREKYHQDPANKDRCPGFVKFVVEKMLEL